MTVGNLVSHIKLHVKHAKRMENCHNTVERAPAQYIANLAKKSSKLSQIQYYQDLQLGRFDTVQSNNYLISILRRFENYKVLSINPILGGLLNSLSVEGGGADTAPPSGLPCLTKI